MTKNAFDRIFTQSSFNGNTFSISIIRKIIYKIFLWKILQLIFLILYVILIFLKVFLNFFKILNFF